jgi:hypothetical protein
MSTTTSFEALRRANPRIRTGFAEAVEATADVVRAGIATSATDRGMPRAQRLQSRRSLVRISAVGVTLATAAVAAAFLTIGSSGKAPGVENAAAAIKKAATVTAASAEQSGTAVVQITHHGETWAGSSIRWHDHDISVSRGAPSHHGKVGDEMRVVNGTLYGPDENGGWVALGDPANIDPDSGTTPAEYLAAVREDVGGATLRRITEGMTAVTTRQLDDGSTVYSGTVAAGLIARETGFKEGEAIRVLPFGYVAHDEAADPSAPLDVAVTVGVDGVVREIAVTWGSTASAWRYTVTYSALGATPAPVAPVNARSLNGLRQLEPSPPAAK